MTKADVDLWQKLEARSKKLETALRSARIRKASQVYHLVSAAGRTRSCSCSITPASKRLQERLRTLFQKYLPLVPGDHPGGMGRPCGRQARDAPVQQSAE